MSMKGIDIDKARILAQYLEGDAQQSIKEISSKCLNVVEELQDVWLAKNAEKTLKDMTETTSTLDKMAENFLDIADWLNHYATQAEQMNA